MIELLEYSNALEMTHIALTADIARTNTTIASNLTDVNLKRQHFSVQFL